MIKFFKNHMLIFWECVALLSLIFLLVLFCLLRLNQDISEWWSLYPARWYMEAMGSLTRVIPFSLTELFFISTGAFIILLIVLIVKDLRKKKYNKAISRVIAIPLIVMSIVTNYFFACGFAYNRKPVALPFYETQVENDEFIDIHNYFVTDLNNCVDQLEFISNGDVKTNLTIPQISKLVEKEYTKIKDKYFHRVAVRAKPMLTSFVYRELQITGVTFSSLNEANINYLATNVEIPFVIAHELAHTKGVIREDEANQVAFYVCLNSDNIYLRFSAYAMYFYQISRLTSKGYMKDEDRAKVIKYDNRYAIAVNHSIDYWKKHDLLSKIGDWFNDLYIKLNGVKEGTESYSGGTSSSINPGSLKLNASQYQKLFFEKYYRLNPKS